MVAAEWDKCSCVPPPLNRFHIYKFSLFRYLWILDKSLQLLAVMWHGTSSMSKHWKQGKALGTKLIWNVLGHWRGILALSITMRHHSFLKQEIKLWCLRAWILGFLWLPDVSNISPGQLENYQSTAENHCAIWSFTPEVLYRRKVW